MDRVPKSKDECRGRLRVILSRSSYTSTTVGPLPTLTPQGKGDFGNETPIPVFHPTLNFHSTGTPGGRRKGFPLRSL